MSTRPVPTNLDSWPRVVDLLLSQKYFLHVLWSSDSKVMSVIGVGRPGIIERLCGASRLDEPVVLEALRELDRRGLVVLDEVTREVAIRGWVRFHKFKGRWAEVAEVAFEEVQSTRIKAVLVQQEGLKAIFPKKSDASPPTAAATATASSTAAEAPAAENNAATSEIDAAKATLPPPPASPSASPNQAPPTKVRRVRQSGIVTWMEPRDVLEAERIEAEATAKEIEGACVKVRKASGKDPVPGMVWREIEAARARQRAEEAYQALLNTPPAPSGFPPADEEGAGGERGKEERWNKTLEALPPDLQPKKRAA